MVLFLRPPSGLRPQGVFAQVKLRRVPELPALPVGPFETRALIAIDDNRVVVDRVNEGETYEIKLRTITLAGRVSSFATATHSIVGKSLPPPDVQSFDCQRMIDGTRRFSWDLGIVPPDIAGVLIRYGPGGSGAWAALTPLHDGILEGASPVEFNVPPAGYWRFAIKSIDTSGNESTNAVTIDRTLGAPRQDNVAFSFDAANEGWPGTKTSCFVSTGNVLEALSSDTFATIPGTWTAWTRWNLTPISPISYLHEIDSGFVFDFEPTADVSGLGAIVVDFQSSEDGITWTAFANLETLRTIAVHARFSRFRVTVTATGGQPIPELHQCAMYLRAKTREHVINDLDTATLAATRRLGVGDVRLPIPDGMFAVVRGVSLSFNGTGAGWSWELLDRDEVAGPRVRIFNPSDVAADSTIDAVVRGY
jgi:hypothetical protein